MKFLNRGQLPFLALIVLILLLAAGVRLHNLEVQSFWYDEGVAYGHSQRGLLELIPRLQNNVHVPAYFGSLAIWEDFTGSTEFALRAYSVLWSVVSVAAAYALGKRLFAPLAGIAAAAFVALNTFSIHYAQETRMYAMLAALATLAMWAFVGFVQRINRQSVGAIHESPRKNGVWRWGLAFALLNIVGVYTHVAYALVMLTQGAMAVLWLVALVWRAGWRISLRAFLTYSALNLLTLLAFAPWILTAISQISAQPNISAGMELAEILRILQGWFAFGITYEESISGGMGVVVYFLLLFGLITPRGSKRDAWWALLLPVVWVILSSGLYLYLELYERYLRFLLPAQIGFALWMGRGIWVLWNIVPRSAQYKPDAPTRYLPKVAAVVALLAFCYTMAGGLNPLYNDPDYQRDDYRGMVQRIETESGENAAVILTAPGLQEIYGYYDAGELPVYPLPASPDIVGDTEAVIAEHDRIFVVIYGADEQDPQGLVLRTLNTEAYPLGGEWVGDVRLERFVSPADFPAPQSVDAQFGENITLRSAALSSENLQAGGVLQVQLQWETDSALDTRYKVFVQILNSEGVLVAQHDSEPAGGTAPTNVWHPGETVLDLHALVLPLDALAGDYTVIVGLYDTNNPSARLTVGEGDYLPLATIAVE